MSKKSKKLSHREKMASMPKESLITRISIFTLLILISVFGIVAIPKEILNYDSTYTYAVSKSYIKDEKTDLALYDFDVFPTREKFNESLENDIPNVINKAKEDNKILVVKLPGEEKSLHVLDNYLLMYDPKVPELNIEYYVVQNIYIFNKTVPTLTALTYYKDLEPKINLGYLIVISLIASILIITFLTFDAQNLIELQKRRKTSGKQ